MNRDAAFNGSTEPGGQGPAQPDRGRPEADDGREFPLMNALAAPIFLIDDGFRMLRCNEAGRRMLEEEGNSFAWILQQPESRRAQELRETLAEALAAHARRLWVMRPASPTALMCWIIPLHGPAPVSAVLALAPLEGGSPPVESFLRQQYKLSKAEAEVAIAAAAGVDVAQMARDRCVSVPTLRAQIASIKAKMGMTRMTEIAVTVARIDAAVTWL